MVEIPPTRQEYTVEEIVKEGKSELFAAFEQSYRSWLNEKVGNWKQVRNTIMLTMPAHAFQYLDQKIIPEVHDSPNFNLYKGDLERACAAAKQLVPRYDVGMGIAKKGLWTSFIFNLCGLPVHDVLMIRGEGRRFAFPLGLMLKKDVRHKKVLVFDNDTVTGGTIKAAVENLKDAHVKSVDALLIYACTELKPEYYTEIKSQFKNNPTVIGERDGVVVIDTRSEVQPHVRKVMTLQTDYEPRPELLTGLAKKLGVHYEPKA